jgi:hypothetical protein
MSDITVNVTVYFNNGFSIERNVPIARAVSLTEKDNVYVDTETEYVKISTVNGNIVIPLNLTIVVPKAVVLKHVDRVSRYLLYKRDGGKCGYCGTVTSPKEGTIDHIVPVSKGGQTVWTNVVWCCKKCNTFKDDSTLKEKGMELLTTPYNPKKKK